LVWRRLRVRLPPTAPPPAPEAQVGPSTGLVSRRLAGSSPAGGTTSVADAPTTATTVGAAAAAVRAAAGAGVRRGTTARARVPRRVPRRRRVRERRLGRLPTTAIFFLAAPATLLFAVAHLHLRLDHGLSGRHRPATSWPRSRDGASPSRGVSLVWPGISLPSCFTQGSNPARRSTSRAQGLMAKRLGDIQEIPGSIPGARTTSRGERLPASHRAPHHRRGISVAGSAAARHAAGTGSTPVSSTTSRGEHRGASVPRKDGPPSSTLGHSTIRP
jgi:hypothetical protein